MTAWMTSAAADDRVRAIAVQAGHPAAVARELARQ